MKPLNLTSEILTRQEGAALLKMSQPTFDSLYKSGRLPVIKAGRLKRFRKSDVMALAGISTDEQKDGAE
jgi:excisionase family DNA binding protein